MFRRAFELCDEDNSGTIDLEELKTVLQALSDVSDVPPLRLCRRLTKGGLFPLTSISQQVSDVDAEGIMKEMDTDGNGTISFEEFAEAMAKWLGN